MRRLRCKVGRHRWVYFIDGSICRRCVACQRFQFDLPTGMGPSSLSEL